MATIQRRKNSWRVQVRRNGKSISASFDAHADAEAWGIRCEAKILKGLPVETIKKEPADPNAISAANLITRYANQVSPKMRGCRWERCRLNKLVRDFVIFQRSAIMISGPDMADWRDLRLAQVSASSVNRELCLISAVFSKAIKEWRIGLTINPVSLIEKPRKPRHRTQRVPAHDLVALLTELGWDGLTAPNTPQQWTAFAFSLAIATAMRKGEILSLQWRDIHLERRVAHLDMTKNGDARDVPLSKEAMRLLKLMPNAAPAAWVIPIESGYLDKLFRDARRGTGLIHIRFHDSRREAASTMAKKFNVLELAAITGHKSLQMLQIYYTADATELAERLDG